MVSEFGFKDTDGQVVRSEGITDSGAAQCALKHSFLTEHLPGLAKQVKPTKKRFLDASDHPMDIVGTVELTLLIG